ATASLARRRGKPIQGGVRMKRSFLIHRSPGHLAAAIGALLSQGCSDDDSPTAVFFDWDSGVSWDAGDLTTDETSSTATAEVPAEPDASVDDTSTSAPTTSVLTELDESTLDTTTSDPTSSTSTEIDASIDASTTATSDGADASDSPTSTSSQTTTTSETTSFILDAGSPDAALDASESDASESDASEEDGGGFDGSADADACNSCSN